MSQKSNTIIITVSSINEREKLTKTIYGNLTSTIVPNLVVQQDQVNRIKVFHNVGDGIKVLIRTYIVVVIPIIVDLGLLDSFTGAITFHLDDTIEHLTRLINKLQSLQGYRIVKGNNNAKALEQLVDQLRGANGEY